MREVRLLPVFLSLTLIACTSVSSGQGSGTRMPQPVDVAQWSGDLPISSPWLREQLPAAALVYQRIPHPLAMMAIPKGNTFDTALRSEANIQSLIEIQRGLVENLGVELPPLRLLEHLRAPIEIVAMATPAPSGVIGTTLSFRSNEAFEAFITELGQFAPISLSAPLDAEGYGQIVGGPIPILVRFDAATGRLALYGGLVPDRATFATLLQAPEEPVAHPMHALERQVDESGQGLFAWVNAAQAIQTAAMFNPEMASMLTATGANRIRGIAAGAGVANGKGRLKLLADLGNGNENRPVPVINNVITATSVGAPRSLLLLSVPSPAEFQRLESVVLGSMPPEAAGGWAGVKGAIAEATGTTIEELLSAIGPELMTVSDAAGGFLGIRVRDRALLDGVLDAWSARGGFSIEQRAVEGRTIRYADLPGTIGMPNVAIEGEGAALLGMLGRMRSRAYWIEEGDYLYMASTPQILIDRIRMGADTNLAEWLNETQRVDFSSALLAATGSARNLPQAMYNGYIGLMQGLADMVDVDYDIWSMPTASQLGLPDRGALGASISLGEPYVAFELSYESHPAELLFGGGGMAAMAAAGIAAAIALPAYRDYAERAEAVDAVSRSSAAVSGADAATVQ